MCLSFKNLGVSTHQLIIKASMSTVKILMSETISKVQVTQVPCEFRSASILHFSLEIWTDLWRGKKIRVHVSLYQLWYSWFFLARNNSLSLKRLWFLCSPTLKSSKISMVDEILLNFQVIWGIAPVKMLLTSYFCSFQILCDA